MSVFDTIHWFNTILSIKLITCEFEFGEFVGFCVWVFGILVGGFEIFRLMNLRYFGRFWCFW